MFDYSVTSYPFLIVTDEDGVKSLLNFLHIVQIKSREPGREGCVIYMRDGRSTISRQSIDEIHRVISGAQGA